MTMTPILFPYTTISPSDRDTAGRFFPALTLIGPLESEPEVPKVSAGGPEITVHVPATDRRAELRHLIDDYRLWAQQHPGTDLAAWAGRGETVPFFDETSVARIRSDIRRSDTARPGANPLFDCRLFLGIAEAFDRQMAETARSLGNLEKAESRMLSELRGETALPLRRTAGAEQGMDALIYMVPRRIRAWAGLYLSAPLPNAVFITLARDVIGHLTEMCGQDQMRHIGTIPPPKSRSTLMQQLEATAGAPRPPAEISVPAGKNEALPDSRDFQLEIYLAPDRRPEKFFAAFSPPGIDPPAPPASFRHTLIGLLTG
jgi:hypothetical protein